MYIAKVKTVSEADANGSFIVGYDIYQDKRLRMENVVITGADRQTMVGEIKDRLRTIKRQDAEAQKFSINEEISIA